MSDLEKRRKRAVEYILENEALTSDLEDAAALKLNEWGMRLAVSVANETSNMKHNKGLEHIGERIRSLRRLMRNINRLSGRVNRLDEDAHRDRFKLILKHAKELHGKRFPDLSNEEKEQILQRILKRRDNSVDLVEALTTFIDDAAGDEEDKSDA
ncbi:MAG: hypothetical protein QNJ26_09780 [Desulfobacterales bacterium]|nr:hypothetical protein [Desulfobacterales bacterium]